MGYLVVRAVLLLTAENRHPFHEMDHHHLLLRRLQRFETPRLSVIHTAAEIWKPRCLRGQEGSTEILHHPLLWQGPGGMRPVLHLGTIVKKEVCLQIEIFLTGKAVATFEMKPSRCRGISETSRRTEITGLTEEIGTSGPTFVDLPMVLPETFGLNSKVETSVDRAIFLIGT